MATIEKLSVDVGRFASNWGVAVYDYNFQKTHTDLQDLLVLITQNRAAVIEQEILPLQDIISRRNTRIERYGAVLQKLTEVQAQFTNEDTATGQAQIGSVLGPDFTADDFWKILGNLGYPNKSGSDNYTLIMSKAEVEGAVARCKNVIDEMNNDSQRDMTRLQAIVDRRDESFSAATNLMTSVSDTRSALIKNL